MTNSPLDASPIAEFLFSLVQRQATGHVEIGGRRLSLSKGDVLAISPAQGDEPFGELLVKSGLLSAHRLDEVQKKADAEHLTLETALIKLELVPESDLSWARRALWLDRLVRSLRAIENAETGIPALEHGTWSRVIATPEPLAPLVLDALARCATEGDAETVGGRLNYRLSWIDGPLTQTAREWAKFPASSAQQPLVSSILVKMPAGAPIVAAVVRAGVARLIRPGSQPAAPRTRKITLPPPSPRLSILPLPNAPGLSPAVRVSGDIFPKALINPKGELQDEIGSEPAQAFQNVEKPPLQATHPLDGTAASVASPIAGDVKREGTTPIASAVALDETDQGQGEEGSIINRTIPSIFDGASPESAFDDISMIPRATLRHFTLGTARLEDPLAALEERITSLQQANAPGAELAPVWCDLARLWRIRIGSIEESARAYREAAANDLTSQEAIERASLLYAALGDIESASAYAGIIAVSAQTGAERAHALRFIASLARARGDVDGCLDALCEAAAEDETNPEPHEQVARILAEQSNFDGAIAHARLAAKVWQDEHPERARATLAWASTLKMSAPLELSFEYADLLRATGRSEAAIAVIAEAARQTNDPDTRRRLILNAAQHAEEIGRTDLAVEWLLEAFDYEPYVDIYYEPLIDDLEVEGLKADVAVIAEEISTVCSEEQKSYWLLRAGEATLPLAGRGESALLLLLRAIRLDPLATRPLELLRQHATSGRDRALLAEALRLAAQARVIVDPQTAKALFEELATLAEEQLGAVHQALGAWKSVQQLSSEDERVDHHVARLSAKARIHRGLLEAAENELNGASAKSRPKIARKVAAMLRDRRDAQSRVVDLYTEYVTAFPEDEAAASALEWLLGSMEEHPRLIGFLQSRLDKARRTDEKEYLLTRLAAEKSRVGDYQGVAAACLELLSTAPQHVETIARLNRAAVKLGDSEIWRKALTYRAEASATARQRGRALARLAKLLESCGEVDPAIIQADAALVADPTAADAALLVLRHAFRLSNDRAVQSLDSVRSALGDSQPLLATLARAASVSDDLDNHRRALEAWCWLTPLDPEPVLALLGADIRQDDVAAIIESARAALNRDVVSPATAAALHAATSRLAALGALGEAARVAIEAMDALGDVTFLNFAMDTARRSGERELIVAALEREVAFRQNEERVNALRELARYHYQNSDPLAEVRAHLRLLAQAPGDIEALDRLASVYTDHGESDRLLVVLSLALDATRDLEQKRTRLIDLAAAYAQLKNDLKGSEKCIRTLILDYPVDPGWTRSALGALFAIGDDSWACDIGFDIASKVPADLGERVCGWLAASAQQALGNSAAALRVAARAFERFPTNHKLLAIVERLALVQKDTGLALSVYERLADIAVGSHGRRATYYRAGRWFELAKQPEQALEQYRRSFVISPSAGAAFKAIERLAHQHQLWMPLVDAYQALAEAVSDRLLRADLLQKAGEICQDRLNDPERALKLYEQARQASGKNEPHDDATETVERVPPSESVVVLENSPSIVPAPITQTSNPPNVIASGAPSNLDGSTVLLGEEENAVREAVERGDTQAILPLADMIAKDASRLPEAGHLLRKLVRQQPWHTQAIRQLHQIAVRLGGSVEAATTEEILSLFDTSVASRTPAQNELVPLSAEELDSAIDPVQSPDLRRLFTLIWEGARAIPRLRKHLRSYQVTDSDRLAPTGGGELARAFAMAAWALDMEGTPLYVKKSRDLEFTVAATHLPAIIVSSAAEKQSGLLPFQFVRYLVLTKPENVLLAGLEENERDDVLYAIVAALGPTESQLPVNRNVTELAAELWRAMPMRSQREARGLIQKGLALNDHHAIYQSSVKAAARIGLLLTGSVPSALAAIAAFDVQLRGIDIRQEHGFIEACYRSIAFSELINFALSTTYLASRSR